MKTIYILICLIVLGGCKKEEDKEPVTNTIEVRFTGKWEKFQGMITYYHGSEYIAANVDSTIYMNIDGTDNMGRRIYKYQGYSIPYSATTKQHISATILDDAKYNMNEGEWVYIELYENGKLFSHTDTLTVKNIGLVPYGHDVVRK